MILLADIKNRMLQYNYIKKGKIFQNPSDALRKRLQLNVSEYFYGSSADEIPTDENWIKGRQMPMIVWCWLDAGK